MSHNLSISKIGLVWHGSFFSLTRIMKNLLVCSFLALFILTGCQTETVPPLLDVAYASDISSEPVLVQSFSVAGKSEQEVRKAIIRAATVREWDVEELDDGRIQAKLVHRTSDSTLWFTTGNGQVKIHSLSYEMDKKTQARKERAEPEGWIRNLHKDILELLGLLPEK